MAKQYNKKGYLLEDFHLFHLKDIHREKVDYHYHEFYKLVFLLSGTGGYSVEGKRYLVKAGDIVLVENQAVHRPEFEDGVLYERIILYISPEFLRRESTEDCDLTECFSGEYGHILRPEDKSQKLFYSLITQLENELSNENFGHTIAGKSILLRLFVELSRHFRHEKSQKPAPILPKNKRILEIMEYLDTHLTEEISIDILAEKFYLSRYHMMRKFKEETGMTIHNYIAERRLFLAHDYIIQGHLATEACFLCGYQSYASFSRAYSKLFGTTPTGRKIGNAAVEETFE